MSSAKLFPLVLYILQAMRRVSTQQCSKSELSSYGEALIGSVYRSILADHLGICILECSNDENCASINFYIRGRQDRKCEQNKRTKRMDPAQMVTDKSAIYFEFRKPAFGNTRDLAMKSCKQLKEIGATITSGVYWVNLTTNSTYQPTRVYCDMETDGGGWTLVYSYTFTNFANFKSYGNSVTPIPNWSYSSASAKSTTIPLNESVYSAMEFPLWKNIGTEFMVKSNIVHWIACSPGTGDFVNWQTGTLDCRVVKNTRENCLNAAPNRLDMGTCGPHISKDGKPYYYFDGGNSCYPVHDPCANMNNVLPPDKPNPSGAVYIR